MKVRLNPWRNLGCIGLYGCHWAMDLFVRPYIGMFVRRGNTRIWINFQRLSIHTKEG